MRRRTARKNRRTGGPPVVLETKWGWWPCIDEGWCVVPAALVRCAAGLGITAEEGWLLVQLLDVKWSEGHGTLHQLSERFGASPEYIYTLFLSLQGRGFLRLISKAGPSRGIPGPGAEMNLSSLTGMELDLSPLVHILSDYIMKQGDLSAGFLRVSPPTPPSDSQK